MTTHTTPCETCAFVSGTEANRTESTALKANLCVQAREPFYCHEALNKIQREGFTNEEAFDIAEQDGELRLCAGYVEAVRRMAEAGFYDNQTPEEVEKLKALVEMICDAEAPYVVEPK